LNNLTLLSTLSFTDLTAVGAINWAALPALPQLTFPSVITKAANVVITNTFLSTLDGINLATVGTMNINNNNRLKTFSTQVANITQLLNIDSNGRLLDVSFPNLIWAANMTFRNVSSVSLPSLAVVNGSLGFYENYFTSVAAPNLTQVTTGGLAFVANPSLANISFPLLATIGGGDLIANNSALGAIAFPVLSDVGGAIDFSGNFTTPSMPELSNVKGNFNLQSSADIDCSGYQTLSSSKTIQGLFTCKTTNNVQTGTTGTSTGTASSASATSSKKSAAMYYGANTQAVFGLSFIGGLLQMLL